MVKAGVLGGTFDPPHIGHLVLAAAARQTLDLDCVYFVPAGDPWRKAGRPLSAVDLRVRLVKAATAGLQWARVSMVEADRPGPSYSAETLTEFTREGGEWWLILGQDALADLPNWHEPRKIVELARLAVGQRSPEGELVTQSLRQSIPGIEQRIDLVTMPDMRVSSTELRTRVSRKDATGVLIPAGVRDEIEELGLYRDTNK